MNAVKGVQLRSVIKFLEDFAVPKLAEKWDNVGLIVEPITPVLVKNILLTIDLTEDVVAEAVSSEAQLIISYHPPIFSSLKKINTSTWKGRILGACLENKIAVFSPHTSWDNADGGVADWLLSPFELSEKSAISKNDSECGRIGTLGEELKLKDVVERIRELTKVKHMRLALARNKTIDNPVKRIAVCAGSGGSVLQGTDADLYLTGEMSHHTILDAIYGGSSVLLLEHSASERGFLSHYAPCIRKEFPDLKVVVSQTDKEPLSLI